MLEIGAPMQFVDNNGAAACAMLMVSDTTGGPCVMDTTDSTPPKAVLIACISARGTTNTNASNHVLIKGVNLFRRQFVNTRLIRSLVAALATVAFASGAAL